MPYKKILLVAALAVLVITLAIVPVEERSAVTPQQERAPQQQSEHEPALRETVERVVQPTPVHSYAFVADSAGTVESLMQEKRADGSFTYTSRPYPTLGSFLESVGGIRNGNGTYWMLYINGALSSQGMSQAAIVPGDRIEWRYE